MVEVVGDYLEPSEIMIPLNESSNISGLGLVFISGSKIWFHTGTAYELVTSA